MRRISVVVPAFNAASTLARAIESVLGQSHPAAEIIVVNDGSSDNTPAVAQKYRSNVQLLNLHHGGVSRARNHGIEASSGEWIAFLDADDQWMPEKLAIQLARTERHPSAALVATGAEYERNGRIYKATRTDKVGHLVRDLLLGNCINTSTVMVRRSALDAPPKRFPVDIGFGEDWEMWVALAAANEILLIPDVLAKTFRSGANASSSVDAEKFFEAQMSMYTRLRRIAALDSLIAEMWPVLIASASLNKARFLYDHGFLREARKIVLGEILSGRRTPDLAQALKILLMPLTVRNALNSMLAIRRI
jgi:glycosyltransferase involved in cell wall biosynthesis